MRMPLVLAIAICGVAATSFPSIALAQTEVTLPGFETRGHAVVAAPDGGFFLVGVRRTHGEGGSQPLVARLGGDLAPAWVKAYPKKGHFHPTVGDALADGGVVLAGEADPHDAGWHFWAMAVDAKGKELWSLLVGPAGKNLVPDGVPKSYEATAVLGTSDGGAWLGGHVGVGTTTQGLVVRVDKRGTPRFSTHFGQAERHDSVLQLIADGDGVKAVVRQNAVADMVTPDLVYVQSIDAQGGLGARIDFAPSVTIYNEPVRVQKLPDGRWVMFGKGSWIAMFNADGSRQWLREYRELDGAELTGATFTGDGFVAVGGIDDGKVRLVGFDMNGVRTFEKARRRGDEAHLVVGGLARAADGRVVFASTVEAEGGDFALTQVVDTTPVAAPPGLDLPHCDAGTTLAEARDPMFGMTALVCMQGGSPTGARVVPHPSPTVARAVVTPGVREIDLIMAANTNAVEDSFAVPGRDFFRFGAIEGDLVVVNGNQRFPNTVFHDGHGVWVERFPNGTDRLAVQLKGGFAQGPFRRHHFNGQLAETGAFVDGLPDGEWTRYDEAGKPLGQFTLTRGSGTVTEWDRQGQVSRRVAIHNGKLHGWDVMLLHGAMIWATCNRDGQQVVKERIDGEAGLAALKAKQACD